MTPVQGPVFPQVNLLCPVAHLPHVSEGSVAPPTLPRAQTGLRSPLSSSPRKGWTCQAAVCNRQPLRVVASAPLSALEWWPLPLYLLWSGGLCPSVRAGLGYPADGAGGPGWRAAESGLGCRPAGVRCHVQAVFPERQ